MLFWSLVIADGWILQVPIIRLKAHILPHQCELGDISLSVKETSPMGTSSELADGSPTSQGSGDSFVKEGPWGSEADRQTVRLDISFEAPSNTGLRTSELVSWHKLQICPLNCDGNMLVSGLHMKKALR